MYSGAQGAMLITRGEVVVSFLIGRAAFRIFSSWQPGFRVPCPLR